MIPARLEQGWNYEYWKSCPLDPDPVRRRSGRGVRICALSCLFSEPLDARRSGSGRGHRNRSSRFGAGRRRACGGQSVCAQGRSPVRSRCRNVCGGGETRRGRAATTALSDTGGPPDCGAERTTLGRGAGRDFRADPAQFSRRAGSRRSGRGRCRRRA